jgi:GNAT superfamily N-acetyltransferase
MSATVRFPDGSLATLEDSVWTSTHPAFTPDVLDAVCRSSTVSSVLADADWHFAKAVADELGGDVDTPKPPPADVVDVEGAEIVHTPHVPRRDLSYREKLVLLGQRPDPESGGRFTGKEGDSRADLPHERGYRRVQDPETKKWKYEPLEAKGAKAEPKAPKAEKAPSAGWSGTVNTGKMTPDQAARFEQLTGESLDAAARRMAATVPGDVNAKVEAGPNYWKIDVQEKGPSGDPDRNTVTLTVYDHGAGEIEYVHLRPDQQGKGTNKAIVKEMFDTFDRAGVTKVSLDANEDVGGYVWARLGAEAVGDPRDEEEFTDAVEHNTARMSRKAVEAIDDILDRGGKGMMRRLADLEVDGEKVGKRALLGSEWSGRFNLTDPEVLRRLKHYAGFEPKGKK